MLSRFQLIALLIATFALPGQSVCLAQQVPQKAGPTLLVDTDRECQVTIDGKDVGTITPAKPASFPITIGEHIVRAYVKDTPDMQWRELVNVNANKQYAVAISLREAVQSKSQIATGNDKAGSSEKAATDAKESTSGATVPLTGKYIGASIAPDSSDEKLKRYFLNNQAQFALQLMGREGNYIKAVLEVMATGREEDKDDSGVVDRTTDIQYYTVYRMFLAPSATVAQILESHTCTKSKTYEVVKSFPKVGGEPLRFNSDDGTYDCSKELLSLTFTDETEVSLKSINVDIYESSHDFNSVTLKKTF